MEKSFSYQVTTESVQMVSFAKETRHWFDYQPTTLWYHEESNLQCTSVKVSSSVVLCPSWTSPKRNESWWPVRYWWWLYNGCPLSPTVIQLVSDRARDWYIPRLRTCNVISQDPRTSSYHAGIRQIVQGLPLASFWSAHLIRWTKMCGTVKILGEILKGTQTPPQITKCPKRLIQFVRLATWAI